MKKAVTSDDIHRLIPLSKAAYALEKLIRTHHKIFIEKQDNLKTAMENVIRKVLVPLGPKSIHLVLTNKFPAEYPPDKQKTNKPENESEYT
jgi:hypothetical protein